MHFSPTSRQLLDEAARLTPEQFRRLKPQTQKALKEILRQSESLLDFIPRVTPRWVRPVHLSPLTELIERAFRGPVLGCGSVPPRHGKTETLLHAIAWWLTRRPEDTLCYVTYAAEVAESKSMLARDYARAAGVELRSDKNALNEWRTTAGGGLLATGVGGPLTGHGVRFALVDDPFKNRVEAESTLIRQRTWDWFTSTLTTRVEPGGSRLVVHQRWHEDDTTGRLLASKDEHWEHVNLPAINSAGEALWPERWPVSELEAKRAAVGEYDWYSLFQGSPRPKGGQVFGDPARYIEPARDGARIVLSVDAAGTEGTHSDYTAAVALAARGYGAEMVADVLEVARWRLEPQKVASHLRDFQVRHGGGSLLIEATRDGKALHRALTAIDPSLQIREVVPTGDKYTRAQPLAAAWNQGRIRLPMHAPWLADTLAEFSKFTGLGDLHDDIVDAASQAFSEALLAAPFEVSRIRSKRY